MAVIFIVGSGPGATHATVQAAFDAIPAAPDQPYFIQIQNEQLVTTGFNVHLVVSARTTTPTNSITIEPVPGGGWKDHVDAGTNPLRYDSTKGASLRCQNNHAILFSGTVNHLTVRGLQFIQESTIASNDIDVIKCQVTEAATNRRFEDLIIEVVGADVTSDGMALGGINDVVNCTVIYRGSNPSAGIRLNDYAAGQSAIVVGCTIVRPSNLTPAGVGLLNAFNGNTMTAKNCAVFGFATASQDLDTGTDFNATNLASGLPGSNNVFNVPFTAATFVQPSDASGLHNFRLVAGSDLEDAGIFDASYPNDALGNARGNPPDIGALEIAAAGAIVEMAGVASGRSDAQSALSVMRGLSGQSAGQSRALGSLFLASEFLNALAIDSRIINGASWEDGRTISLP